MLGFCINYRKSNLAPTTKCKFLGFIIDTKKYAIELTNEKRTNIAQLVETILSRKICTIRKFAQLIGKLTACCAAVEYAWLYTKLLERKNCFNSFLTIIVITK